MCQTSKTEDLVTQCRVISKVNNRSKSSKSIFKPSHFPARSRKHITLISGHQRCGFPSTVPVLGLSYFAWVGAACNADDCSRPLQGNAAAASCYCSTYTKATATATTGFPSYIPTTYGPSRVSSVCTCLASSTSGPTTTAQPACSTGQVVLKPSFYGLPPFMQLISSLGPSIIMAAPLGACLIHIAITR